MDGDHQAGDETMSTLVDQYKLYVELTDRVSGRRVDAGKFYTTLLTGLLAVVPFAVDEQTPPDIRRLIFFLLGLLGIILCVLWIVNIRSYKQLNALKFRVIHEMEEQLPFPAYDREWEILQQEPGRYSYLRLSRVEQFVPLLLMVPYIVLVIASFVLG